MTLNPTDIIYQSNKLCSWLLIHTTCSR